MIRMQIVLDSDEAESLARWAAQEMREPRDQIRFVLRREMQNRGLLLLETSTNVAEKENNNEQAIPARI